MLMIHYQADSERSAVFGQMRGTVFGMSSEDNVQHTHPEELVRWSVNH